MRKTEREMKSGNRRGTAKRDKRYLAGRRGEGIKEGKKRKKSGRHVGKDAFSCRGGRIASASCLTKHISFKGETGAAGGRQMWRV